MRNVIYFLYCFRHHIDTNSLIIKLINSFIVYFDFLGAEEDKQMNDFVYVLPLIKKMLHLYQADTAKMFKMQLNMKLKNIKHQHVRF